MSEQVRYLEVGHVKDAHGIKGEVFIRLFAKTADWLDELKSIRLKSRSTGQIQNYEIEKIKPHKDGLILKLKNIANRNEAEALRGLTFEISDELLKSEPGEDIYLDEVLNFMVIDEKLGEIGVVKSFLSNGPQDLLCVRHDVREILIPFVKDLIVKIDFNNAKIYMNLPEGLCDLT